MVYIYDVGYLAGIMKRFKLESIKTTSINTNNTEISSDIINQEDGNINMESRREWKKREAAEVRAILEEEGVLDEEEGNQVIPILIILIFI